MRGKQSILWKNLKIFWKSRKIQKKSGKKSGKNQEKNILDLISRIPIMWRNVVKTIEILIFEKNHKKKQKKTKKKKEVIFKLLSFAHEVKILLLKTIRIKKALIKNKFGFFRHICNYFIFCKLLVPDGKRNLLFSWLLKLIKLSIIRTDWKLSSRCTDKSWKLTSKTAGSS